MGGSGSKEKQPPTEPDLYYDDDSELDSDRIYSDSSEAEDSDLSDNTVAVLGDSPLSVFVATWNMGDGAGPDDLSSLFFADEYDEYDIIAIGVQECEYKHSALPTHWVGQLQDNLKGFTLVKYHNMWSIRLAVFVRAEHHSSVSNPLIAKEATGIGSVAGNKGAVAVSFTLYDKSFVFISCHLAAHQGKVANRNAHYTEIVQGLYRVIPRAQRKRVKDVTDAFDFCFWFGDLNYRVDLPREEVVERIEEGDLVSLRHHDQLRHEMLNERVFHGFDTGLCTFPPTYRMLRGTNEYDEAKQRIPSWTDRVLWRTQPRCRVRQVVYNSCPDIQTSDHHPVYAIFDIAAPHVPRRKLKKRYTIKITDLSADELISADPMGNSDPFVYFYASTVTAAKTTRKSKTLAPSWEDEEVPVLKVLDGFGPKAMSKVDLCFSLYDWDRITRNDLMGHGFISLAKACGKKPVEFHAQIRHEGAAGGWLSGKIHCVPSTS